MTNSKTARFITVTTLIRIALAVFSLSGIALAQSAGKSTTQQSGNNYNFTGGGGG